MGLNRQWLSFLIGASLWVLCAASEEELGTERVVFQTTMGDITFGFFPNVAPVTSAHILKLCKLGCYSGNHFFRVDPGFVAQVADVMGGRVGAMNSEQEEEGRKSVVGEFSNVKHVRGILSMGRWEDPNSATSSFSVLLGNAPHLDGQYAVFGRVVQGWETLTKMETVETRREGIFVMPLERITIFSTYVYDLAPVSHLSSTVQESDCEEERGNCRHRIHALEEAVEEARRKCLPA